MKINLELYQKIFKLRQNSEQYCFPLRRFLGENGLYENHFFKGKKFIHRKTGEIYTVDDVYVHWFKGWYFVALARKENNSHGAITWNINNTILKGKDFSIRNYKLCN